MRYQQLLAAKLANFGTSYWLKGALQQMESRDPIDALDDAETLLAMMKRRLHEVQGQSRPNVHSSVTAKVEPDEAARRAGL